ncbi:predicted protein [Postia placenta Mad-698-R]|nr:predicted protein [Postia placenta Mad-698-R]
MSSSPSSTLAATSTTPPAPVGSSSSISQITHRPASAIGIAVGAAILGISLLASLGWCYYRYKRGRRKTERGAASDRDKLDDALGIASRLSTTQHVVPSPIHDPRSHPPLLGYVGSEVSTTPATVAPSVYSAHPVLASLDIPKQTASQPRDLREELARRMRGIEEHVAELRRQESSGTVSREGSDPELDASAIWRVPENSTLSRVRVPGPIKAVRFRPNRRSTHSGTETESPWNFWALLHFCKQILIAVEGKISTHTLLMPVINTLALAVNATKLNIVSFLNANVPECGQVPISWSGGIRTISPFYDYCDSDKKDLQPPIIYVDIGVSTDPYEMYGPLNGTSYIWDAGITDGNQVHLAVMDSTTAIVTTPSFTILPGNGYCESFSTLISVTSTTASAIMTSSQGSPVILPSASGSGSSRIPFRSATAQISSFAGSASGAFGASTVASSSTAGARCNESGAKSPTLGILHREELSLQMRSREKQMIDLQCRGSQNALDAAGEMLDVIEIEKGRGEENGHDSLRQKVEFLRIEVERLRIAASALDSPPPSYGASGRRQDEILQLETKREKAVPSSIGGFMAHSVFKFVRTPYISRIVIAETIVLSAGLFGIFMQLGNVNQIINYGIMLSVVTPILSGIVSTEVQLFYGWRIWILSSKKLLALSLVIVLLALGQLVSSIVSSLSISGASPFGNLVYSSGEGSIVPIVMWYSLSALVDMIIAITMFVMLNKRKRGEEHTDALVTRLIKHVVGSGIATASIAVLTLILYIVDIQTPNDMVGYADCPYACTALISLNNRDLVRRGQSDGVRPYGRRKQSTLEKRSLMERTTAGLRRLVPAVRREPYVIQPYMLDVRETDMSNETQTPEEMLDSQKSGQSSSSEEEVVDLEYA